MRSQQLSVQNEAIVLELVYYFLNYVIIIIIIIIFTIFDVHLCYISRLHEILLLLVPVGQSQT